MWDELVTDTYFPEQLYGAGYTDLVCVIPPGAKLTPSSAIPQSQIGKIPGKRLANGLWAGYAWSKDAAPSANDVREWCLANANVGLKADRFPGVDIDCTDEALAAIIQDVALATLGPAPIRTGRAPKRLLMYRTEEPFGRMRLFIEREGVSHMVEVLGKGQQYLVHGTHPITQQSYLWDRAVPRAAKLTPITKEMANRFLDELASHLEMLSCGKIKREGDGTLREASAAEQQSLRAPSMEILRQAVRLIPNTNEFFPTREDYIKMGYAIRASAAREDKDEAFGIFSEWAARWEGNARRAGNDPETVLSDWRRLRGPYSIGWLWIAEQARAFGFDTAGLDFEPVASKPRSAGADAPGYSDQWLAERVVERQRGRIRFLPQRGLFLVWDGGRWQPDAELLAEDVVKKELRAIANELMVRGATKKEKADNALLANAICSSGKVPGVTSLVKSDRAIAISLDALDHDVWALNTPAGIVDLRDGSVHSADPDALCTKSTVVAPDFSGGCPRWRAFLDESTGGDSELVSYLQRLMGYALTGSTREQQLAFIYGSGGNGKSVFLNVLSGILGDYARVASMDTFTASYSEKHSTDIAMLTGARLVTASETQAGKRWDETRLKSLTGGEPVTARFMRQDNFTFLPQFKLIFVGNHKPEIRDVGEAMRRRIQMVPFTCIPKVVDKELGAKLREEWPAILAWMIEGCLAWQLVGLAPPASVQHSTEDYFEEEDAVGRWLEQCVDLDPEGTVTSHALYLSWKEWCNQSGEYVGSLKRLSSALSTRRFERWREVSTRRLGFKGLKLKSRDVLEGLT